MPKEHTVRFAVKNKKHLHSQVWRVWTIGNDCYIGSRGVSHLYKASFHQSGKCQVGLSKEVREKLIGNPKWDGESRLYDQWRVKVDLKDGESIRLIEIIIPNSQLDYFEIKKNKKIEWVECDEGFAASILLIKANISNEIIVKECKGKELRRLPLENGYSVIILFRLIEEKTEYKKFIEDILMNINPVNLNDRDKTYINAPIDNDSEEIRAMIWHKKNEIRYWIEASYRKT